MDYTALARELLKIRAKLFRIPEDQQITQMARGERFVLGYLTFQESAVHPKKLSEEMGVSTARVAALLKNMEKKQLLQRYPDPNDSRQVIVMLTETGKEKILQFYEKVIFDISEVLESIGPEDATTYIRIQKTISDNYLKKH